MVAGTAGISLGSVDTLSSTRRRDSSQRAIDTRAMNAGPPDAELRMMH